MHAGELMAGMASGWGRKNSWTIAEHRGAANPDGLPIFAGGQGEFDSSRIMKDSEITHSPTDRAPAQNQELD